MLTQFRVRYPKGSLISELVRIDRGQYIVRASVGLDGVILATAMAAAETVEQAEDRARERVLAVLALDTSTENEATLKQNSQQESKNPQTAVRAEISSQELKINNRSISSKTAVPVNSTVVDNSTDRAEVETSSNQFDLPHNNENSTSNLPEPNFDINELDRDYGAVEIETDLKETKNTPEAEIEIESSNTGEIELQIEIPMPEEEENQNLEPALSIKEELDHNFEQQTIKMELSDILARTDFHMNRLGWTKEDGRAHLKEIYGKRSRHSLETWELLEFLNFLEAQPDPI